MSLYESGEDYLETILILSEKKPVVRSVDIANEMNVTKPSVSIAMKRLREGGYITVDKDGFISFTDSGRKIAESIYERHTVLTALLVSLGVDEETAKADACKIEHDLSETSFGAIREHFNKYH